MRKLTNFLILLVVLIFACSPTEPEDCTGTEGGEAVIDCAGVCGGDAELDVCENCNGDNSICSFFQLEDLNTSSPTYGTLVGPQTYPNKIRLFYFSEEET